MLIHEVEEGGHGYVGDILFVRPPGCEPTRVPGHVELLFEHDGTVTLSKPLRAKKREGESFVAALLVHSEWFFVGQQAAQEV